VRCITTLRKWSCEPAPKKTLKLNGRVSSLLQVCPLAHFLTAEFGFSGDEFSPSWQGHGGENGNITSILFGIRVRVATAVGRRY
jgi:hypothetical protein